MPVEKPKAPIATVRKPGLATSIQDRGRDGWQAYGVSIGGCADPRAAMLANRAVGNDPNAAVLECTIEGPELLFDRAATIAIAGAPMPAMLNGKAIDFLQPLTINTGAQLSLGRADQGARTYLAIAGGFDGQLFLGSRATHLAAGVGGYKGRALQAGDALYADGKKSPHPSVSMDRNLVQAFHSIPGMSAILRVTPGPDLLRLDRVAQKQIRADLVRHGYWVDPASNRMGVRLRSANETDPSHGSHANMVSGPVYPGTVQMPADGNPIVLGCDCQAMGGYPRLLQVIAADLWLIGQLRPGAQVWFRAVSIEQAREIAHVQRRLINQCLR